MDLEELEVVQRWMRKGEEKGLEAWRGDLLVVLSTRFGKVEKDLEARILRIEDAALLEKLIRRAAVVQCPDHFFREMP